MSTLKKIVQMSLRRRVQVCVWIALSVVTCPLAIHGETIARLGFWVAPDRMEAFEQAYEEQVVPILDRHGFVASTKTLRTSIDSAFTRPFVLDSSAGFPAMRRTFLQDPELMTVRRRLGSDFGETDADAQIGMVFEIYRSPAGRGKRVIAGPGKRVIAGPGKGHWRHFDVPEGLASSRVWASAVDHDGAIWFATEGGISRYDGERFTTFTEADGLFSMRAGVIFCDRDGYVWFGHRGGVSRYAPSSDASGSGEFWTASEGLPNASVEAIAQDSQGNAWFGTRDGLARLDRSAIGSHSTSEAMTLFTTEHGLPGNRAGALALSSDGTLWIGTDGGVCRYDPSGASGNFVVPASLGDLALRSVSAIIEDRDGRLWFGGSLIRRYDPRADEPDQAFVAITPEAGPAIRGSMDICEASDGSIWFASFRSGASRFDGRTLSKVDLPEGLLGNVATSIATDHEGALWITTHSGVHRYDSETLRTFSTEDGLGGDNVVSMVRDRKGNLWIGTEHSGVTRYDGRTFTSFTREDGLPSNLVYAVFEDRDGTLWFGTRGRGIVRYEDADTRGRGTLTNFTTEDGLAGNSISRFFQDNEGNLWILQFGGGATRYDGQTFTTYTMLDGLGTTRAWAGLCDRDGVVWIGSEGGGISRFNGDSGDGQDGPAFTTYTTADGVSHSKVFASLQDRQGDYWFTTWGGGVTHYDGDTFTGYGLEDGLAHTDVNSAFQDRDGTIWFGTFGGGVNRYDGKTFGVLTEADGLSDNFVTSVAQEPDGTLWFGTFDGGLTRYRQPPPVPPSVSIDAVVADRRYAGLPELSVNSDVTLTSFEFHGSSFKTRPEAMIYRYRLTGYEDWRTTRSRKVEYQDLPRGDYTFEVMAVDRDLVYSTEPARVRLTVHLPYERIGWMSALGIAIVVVGGQTVRVIRRDRRLNTANKELFQANYELTRANLEIKEQSERKSAFLASMSHELRTPMNAIKGFTNLVARREESLSDRGKANLEKVDQASEHLLAQINDLLDLSKIEAGKMDVSVSEFDVREAIQYCVSTVSPLVREEVELSADIDASVGTAHTDEQRVRQMVINLLSNAVKFTDAGSVRVSVTQSERGRRERESGGKGESEARVQSSGGRVGGEANSEYRVASAEFRGEGESLDTRPTSSNATRDGHWLVISVSDTGKGIPEDELPTLFDEYRQVQGQSESDVQKGTGLGLSITKKFAELLGGSIEVESEVGKGSVFTVRIPAVYSE